VLNNRNDVANNETQQSQDDRQNRAIAQRIVLKQPLAVGPKMIRIKPHDENVRCA
jgi:hypothetical protein